jgi:conjugative transfer signal peptidase TraF
VKYRLSVVLRFGSGASAVAVATAGLLISLGIHINLSASAPRGLYRAVVGTPLRGAWVAACVPTDAAAVGLARGYLRPGPCPGGAEPILKPVVAVSGDVVDLSPHRVAVNGTSLPDSQSASIDSNGRPLAHATPGRHVVGRRPAVAREHTSPEQLGQPIPRAVFDVRCARDCSPRVGV